VAPSRTRSAASSASRRLSSVEPSQQPQLVLALESVERVAKLARGPRQELGELERDLEPALAALEAVEEQAALADPIPDGACLELALRREEARRARAHQLRQREQVRAAERSAEYGAEPAHETGVEALPDQRREPRRRVAARIPAGEWRGLEGDGGLRHVEPLDARARRVQLEAELHVMDEAGGLQLAAGRHEAALAQVRPHRRAALPFGRRPRPSACACAGMSARDGAEGSRWAWRAQYRRVASHVPLRPCRARSVDRPLIPLRARAAARR
jgi:hypothetical protein